MILKYILGIWKKMELYLLVSISCSVTKSCLTLCDPMDCSMPDFHVLHYLPEFAQTHVRWADDAIQPSHPLLSPSPPAFNHSQHQDLFQWVGSSQWPNYWSFSFSFSISPFNEYLGLIFFKIGWCDLFVVQGLSRVFSSTTVWKHKFFGTQPSLWSNSHI